jgi:predicted metal-dependent peptidase
MAFKDLTPSMRISAVHFDIMRDSEFVLLAGVTQIGKTHVTKDVPTAGTDGLDVYYGEDFIMGMTRPQLRYLVAHENLHKALHHCTAYKTVTAKYKALSNMAMDYVVNQMIEDMDDGRGFVARPDEPKPLIDPQYRDMSFLEVLQRLIQKQNAQQQPQSGQGQPGQGTPGQGDGTGSPLTMDEHMEGGGDSLSQEEKAEVKKQLTDAINQGAITREKMRGDKAGRGAALSGFQERQTDWRSPLRRFVQELCEGDEQSRFSPPNKRFLPLGIVMPSHFSEATGELVIACDTSGSMGGVYPVVFGEIARICQNANPAAVRILWWDTCVNSEQRFTPKDYAGISKLVKPQGGGGTTVSCVADYLSANKIKPKAVILLTDGYIESTYRVPDAPCLWGVVDNTAFRPLKGSVIHISSLTL